MDKNKYEALLVLDTRGKDEGIQETIARLEKLFAAEGAQIEQTQRLEQREFAYEHDNSHSGYYVNLVFSAEPTVLEKLRTKLKLDNDVTLQNFIKLSK